MSEVKRLWDVVSSQSFSEKLMSVLCSPKARVEDLNLVETGGLYLMDSGYVQNTPTELPLSTYGHLLVLRRGALVQQIYIGRTGLGLRFKSGDTWDKWVVLKAT